MKRICVLFGTDQMDHLCFATQRWFPGEGEDTQVAGVGEGSPAPAIQERVRSFAKHNDRSLLFLSLSALATTAHAQSEAPDAPGAHTRDSWYIGFGLGSGPAALTTNNESLSYDEIFDRLDLDGSVRLGFNFQVGVTLSPNLLVGAELAAMSQQVHDTIGGMNHDVVLQHNQYLVAATYFPFEGEGLFVKGGAGLAVAVFNQELGRLSLLATEKGVGGELGVGGPVIVLRK